MASSSSIPTILNWVPFLFCLLFERTKTPLTSKASSLYLFGGLSVLSSWSAFSFDPRWSGAMGSGLTPSLHLSSNNYDILCKFSRQKTSPSWIRVRDDRIRPDRVSRVNCLLTSFLFKLKNKKNLFSRHLPPPPPVTRSIPLYNSAVNCTFWSKIHLGPIYIDG